MAVSFFFNKANIHFMLLRGVGNIASRFLESAMCTLFISEFGNDGVVLGEAMSSE